MGQQLPEGPQILETHRMGRRRRRGAGKPRKVASMLQSADNSLSLKSSSPASNPNSFNPVKTVSSPVEQATIGRSLVIKGEISGSESLYIDGRIEGKISLPDNRITIGRNGSVQANITAREIVIMGKVNGNIECGDRLDIRSEGSVTGDVSTVRISVEDGAVLKGGIQVRSTEPKPEKHPTHSQIKPAETSKPSASEPPKALAAKSGA
jgi:cytoskeletal protein CcmA (bactofilin family)